MPPTASLPWESVPFPGPGRRRPLTERVQPGKTYWSPYNFARLAREMEHFQSCAGEGRQLVKPLLTNGLRQPEFKAKRFRRVATIGRNWLKAERSVQPDGARHLRQRIETKHLVARPLRRRCDRKREVFSQSGTAVRGANVETLHFRDFRCQAAECGATRQGGHGTRCERHQEVATGRRVSSWQFGHLVHEGREADGVAELAERPGVLQEEFAHIIKVFLVVGGNPADHRSEYKRPECTRKAR